MEFGGWRRGRSFIFVLQHMVKVCGDPLGSSEEEEIQSGDHGMTPAWMEHCGQTLSERQPSSLSLGWSTSPGGTD